MNGAITGNIMVVGWKTECMELANSPGRMDENIMVIDLINFYYQDLMPMTNSRDRELIKIKLVSYIKGNGRTENWTDQ
jgi:hypothetical protein